MYRLIRSTLLALGSAAVLVLPAVQSAHAGAVIFNSPNPLLRKVALGVNSEGHLNFFDGTFMPIGTGGFTGLSYLFPGGTWRDATSPGCLCEGWGVSVNGPDGPVSGFVNQAIGSGGLTGGIFGSTLTTASSSLSLAAYPLSINHTYGVSLAPNVFQGNVLIKNEGTDTVHDLVYRRVMDWDVPPTEFMEYVSHFGVVSHLEGVGGNVRFSSDNGFATSDPLASAGSIDSSTVNSDFFQLGPLDHGSVFDFAFGDLAPGQSRSFNIFYGAEANLADAQAAIAILKPDVWSFGQSTTGLAVGGSDYGSFGGSGGAPVTGPVGGSLLTAALVEGVGPGGSGSGPLYQPADDKPTFLFAFGGVGGQEPGATQEEPVMPFVPEENKYEFPAPQPRRWYDPPFVSGFEYSIDSGEFLSFILPSGFSGLDLVVGSTTFADLISDGAKEYFFLSDFGLTGVTKFSITDIAGRVDLADSAAFPTFLDFTGTPTLTMRGLDPIGGSASTVPGPLPVMGCGSALLFARKLRSRIKMA